MNFVKLIKDVVENDLSNHPSIIWDLKQLTVNLQSTGCVGVCFGGKCMYNIYVKGYNWNMLCME